MTYLMLRSQFCEQCDKRHDGVCLVGTGNCYGCGKSVHMKRYFPMMKTQGRENSQVQVSAPNPDAPKKNGFYALLSRSDEESSRDLDTGMLKLISFDVNTLLDLEATLLFVTPLVAMKCEILTEILDESRLISTPVGDYVVVNRFYKDFPLSLTNRVTFFDLIELYKIDFDFFWVRIDFMVAMPLLVVGKGY